MMQRIEDLTAAVKARRAMPQGLPFTRYALALLIAHGDPGQAAKYARNAYGDTPEVALALDGGNGMVSRALVTRSAVAAGTITDANWASPLVQYQNMAADFLSLVRAQSIIGRIANLRHAPMNTRIPAQTAGISAHWVGETAPTPMGSMAFEALVLPPTKISCLVALTKELARFSAPSAQVLCRNDLVAAIAAFGDSQFIDPSVAAIAGTSPASITNGVTPIHSSGTTAAALATDAQAAVRALVDGGIIVDSPVWIAHPHVIMGLAAVNTSGIFPFSSVSINSVGSWLGIPMIPSNGAPYSVSGGGAIVLMNAKDIIVGDLEAIELDASEQAALQFSTAPAGGAQQLVSLWQANLVALKADQFIGWTVRTAAAVTYIDGVTFA